MKNTFLLTILFLAHTFFQAHSTANILNLPHKQSVLANGLRVVLVKYPSPGVVSYHLPVHVGSGNEVEKGKSGFAHFFEHLMFRGTKTMSSTEFGNLYAKLGAENNAYTWFDITDYHGGCYTVYLEKILSAEADRFQNLYFDEKALRDEAGAVLSEYNKSIVQPESVLEEKLLETAFEVHPYGHTTIGYQADILQYPERYKDVWPFFHRYYRPSNVSVILVGDIDFDKSLSLIQSKFGGWKDPAIASVEIPREPNQTAPRIERITVDKPSQTRIAVAYKVPGYSTKNTDTVALRLIMEISFSVTSEFQKLYRFEKKWLDDVSRGPTPPEMKDPGLWAITLRLSEAGESHLQEIIDAFEKTISGLRETPVFPERLAVAKKRLRSAALTRWFATPENLAGQIAWHTNFEPDLDVLNRYVERTEEVTPQTILQFAKEHLVTSGRTTIILQGTKP